MGGGASEEEEGNRLFGLGQEDQIANDWVKGRSLELCTYTISQHR